MSTITFDFSRYSGSITTSSNVGEFNLPEGMANEIMQIVIEPAISNNMYRVDLINRSDNVSMWGSNCNGKLNYTEPFPIWGSYKIRITGASSDDTFRVIIVYR